MGGTAVSVMLGCSTSAMVVATIPPGLHCTPYVVVLRGLTVIEPCKAPPLEKPKPAEVTYGGFGQSHTKVRGVPGSCGPQSLATQTDIVGGVVGIVAEGVGATHDPSPGLTNVYVPY